jgi:hypothetical protein
MLIQRMGTGLCLIPGDDNAHFLFPGSSIKIDRCINLKMICAKDNETENGNQSQISRI